MRESVEPRTSDGIRASPEEQATTATDNTTSLPGFISSTLTVSYWILLDLDIFYSTDRLCSRNASSLLPATAG